MRLQECLRRPNEFGVALQGRAASVEQRTKREAILGTGGIERSRTARFERRDDPAGEIANVDELHGAIRGSRDEDSAAGSYAPYPVRKSIAAVVRSDDQPRAHDERVVAEAFDRCSLAQRFERSV